MGHRRQGKGRERDVLVRFHGEVPVGETDELRLGSRAQARSIHSPPPTQTLARTRMVTGKGEVVDAPKRTHSGPQSSSEQSLGLGPGDRLKGRNRSSRTGSKARSRLPLPVD